jgi:FixJ family two-component response regulator
LALREAVGELKRPRTSKNARDDSYHTFTEDELSEKENMVYQVLKTKPATDREIAKTLGWSINRVTGRRNKLVEKRMVVEGGTVWDDETKRTVIYWGVKK